MSRIWDCIAVYCPKCDAVAGQRCQPLKYPWAERSNRLEVSVPHVNRINKWNREKNNVASVAGHAGI